MGTRPRLPRHRPLRPGCELRAGSPRAEPRTIHEVTLTGLEGYIFYSYSTLSPAESQGDEISVAASIPTAVRTFQTAAGPEAPIGFTVICDSEAQPEVVKRRAEAMWEFRLQ